MKTTRPIDRIHEVNSQFCFTNRTRENGDAQFNSWQEMCRLFGKESTRTPGMDVDNVTGVCSGSEKGRRT